MNPRDPRELAELMTTTLADEGNLIEFGWQALRQITIKPDAPEVQLTEMRFAFYAGAQHLFGSLMVIMRDETPNASETARLDLINRELTAFVKEYEEYLARKRGGPYGGA